MDLYLENLIDECNVQLSKSLKTILSVRNLVDVRNDFEVRITNYFDANIKEQNVIQCRKYCHNLLDQIASNYSSKL